jgi:hypothetical protein
VLISTGLGGKVELSSAAVVYHNNMPGPQARFSTPSSSDSFEKEDGENKREMG